MTTLENKILSKESNNASHFQLIEALNDKNIQAARSLLDGVTELRLAELDDDSFQLALEEHKNLSTVASAVKLLKPEGWITLKEAFEGSDSLTCVDLGYCLAGTTEIKTVMFNMNFISHLKSHGL